MPVYDGDGVRPSDGMAFGPECKGHWVFTASAKADYPPEIVDKMGNPIINQSEVYSGMYGRVNVSFYPYAFGGKKGIGCGLGPVQKLRDGDSLGGSAPSAAQAFGHQYHRQPRRSMERPCRQPQEPQVMLRSHKPLHGRRRLLLSTQSRGCHIDDHKRGPVAPQPDRR